MPQGDKKKSSYLGPCWGGNYFTSRVVDVDAEKKKGKKNDESVKSDEKNHKPQISGRPPRR